MDLDDIGSKLANLTMYDVKSLYRQARNYALNVSEIEAKVDEATNDDPWGASSTLMQEIAAATNNFQDFNEIMPTIYRRFMEKEASEWRQIYKALQLLEYLIKHGSERVVDDARSHLATIKILRNFHYIDEKGKDQGINVRNRAKELSEMLSDVERIRQERRKARQNRSKYTGASNGEFVPGSGTGRYGGFGSDSLYAGNTPSFSGAGGSGGGGGSRESFNEYDAGEYEERTSSSTTRGGRSPAAPAKKEPAAKVVDLFSFDDDDEAAAPAASSSAAAPVAASSGATLDAFGDDFDDFQGAPAAVTPSKSAAAAPTTSPSSNNFDFFGSTSSAAVTSPGYTGSNLLAPAKPLQPSASPAATTTSTQRPQAKPAAASASSGSFNFDDLWASSSGKATGANTGKQKMSMAELAKNQSSSALFGNAPAAGRSQGPKPAPAATKKQDIFDLL